MTRRPAALLLAAVVAAALAGATAAQTPRHVGTPPTALERRGYHLYGEYCLACHGANGAGVSADGSRSIGASPGRSQQRQTGYGPPLRGVGPLAADFYLRTGYMPLPHVGAQPGRRSDLLLDGDQIAALTAYVAWLAPGPAIPKPHPERGSLSEGLQLFTEHCAGCHQIAGRGGYVGGAVAPPLGDATAAQIAEAVRIGPFVMPRYSEGDLTDPQVDSIIRYVRYAARSPNHDGGWGIGYLGPIPEGLVTWLVGALAAVGACVAVGRRLRS